jgi:hypothetical protein
MCEQHGVSTVSVQEAAAIIAKASKQSQQAADRAERVIADYSNLNHIAVSVIRALAFGDSENWLHEKAERLNGKDKLNVLVWLNNLDYPNLTRVANELNVPVDELETTIKTLRSL